MCIFINFRPFYEKSQVRMKVKSMYRKKAYWITRYQYRAIHSNGIYPRRLKSRRVRIRALDLKFILTSLTVPLRRWRRSWLGVLWPRKSYGLRAVLCGTSERRIRFATRRKSRLRQARKKNRSTGFVLEIFATISGHKYRVKRVYAQSTWKSGRRQNSSPPNERIYGHNATLGKRAPAIGVCVCPMKTAKKNIQTKLLIVPTICYCLFTSYMICFHAISTVCTRRRTTYYFKK